MSGNGGLNIVKFQFNAYVILPLVIKLRPLIRIKYNYNRKCSLNTFGTLNGWTDIFKKNEKLWKKRVKNLIYFSVQILVTSIICMAKVWTKSSYRTFKHVGKKIQKSLELSVELRTLNEFLNHIKSNHWGDYICYPVFYSMCRHQVWWL